MSGIRSIGDLSPGSCARFTACLLGLLMLLSFPSQRSHEFTDHLRNATVRRSIACHTSVALPEAGPVDSAIGIAKLPVLLMPIDPARQILHKARIDSVPQVPSMRLLLRSRLRLASADGQDALL
jgi:hypothetical protein